MPSPPCSGGLHILQILNILEGFDVPDLGFGTPDGIHLLAECFKIAFADRSQHVGDPAQMDIPVDWLISKSYADQRRADIDLSRAIDHDMTLQEAVEAPRVWTQGQDLEVESEIPETVRNTLTERGRRSSPPSC